MEFSSLNPFVRDATLYEVINNKGLCKAYDARLIYTISGAILATVGEKQKFNLSAGSVLYIPAGAAYKLKGEHLKAVVVSFDLTDAWSNEQEKIIPISPDAFIPEKAHNSAFEKFSKTIYIEDFEGERDVFLKMDAISTSKEGAWRSRISAMLKLELLKMAEIISESALPPRMVEALDSYIRENAGDDISNTEIGAIFGYHPFYVSRIVKETKGLTLQQYIIKYRLTLAKKMLEATKKTIAEIGEECGFKDPSYFTKSFRQTFGATPKEYRNRCKEEFI